MVSRRTLLAIVPGIFGILLLVGTIQNWNTPSPELQQAQLDVNAAANTLVDTCFSALQDDNGSLAICDSDLKKVQEETCESYSEADICKDGRVYKFFLMREDEPEAISKGTQQTTVLSISDNVDTDISSTTNFRCFQRISTMIDVDESTWYGVTMYTELDGSMCERDHTGMQYGVPMKLDILRADQDIEVNSYGNSNPLYTEYRLLNGTIIAFGEKEIHSS